MKTEEEIKSRIEELEKDQRVHYQPASVFINAPIALAQTSLLSELDTLKWVLNSKG